jgi:hypothetical protein
MTRTISKIIEDWGQGVITTHEVYPALLRLSLEAPLDDVIAGVPEPWRSRFVDWIVTSYDNETPIEDFGWLDSAQSEPEGARRVIAIAREWIGRNRRSV